MVIFHSYVNVYQRVNHEIFGLQVETPRNDHFAVVVHAFSIFLSRFLSSGITLVWHVPPIFSKCSFLFLFASDFAIEVGNFDRCWCWSEPWFWWFFGGDDTVVPYPMIFTIEIGTPTAGVIPHYISIYNDSSDLLLVNPSFFVDSITIDCHFPQLSPFFVYVS